MRVESLHRYPVKSMLGETVNSMFVDEEGAEGDRRLALVDTLTGYVASAKQARLWRGLLQCTAKAGAERVSIGLPDGTHVASDDPDVDQLLSRLLGRSVQLISKRPEGAMLERPDPEKLLELGLEADPTDDAPLHTITTATLDHIGVEALRYRPNLVIATPAGHPPYSENDWIGRELTVGEVRLRVLAATTRCVVPTLEHGSLPRAPQALRVPAAENRWQASGSVAQPCAGAYLGVVTEGVVRVGDRVTLGP